MSSTMKVIERHIASRTRGALVESSAPGLIAEWQERGPETLSRHALRKLRLALAPAQSVITAVGSG